MSACRRRCVTPSRNCKPEIGAFGRPTPSLRIAKRGALNQHELPSYQRAHLVPSRLQKIAKLVTGSVKSLAGLSHQISTGDRTTNQ
jgi:hypothetical protein